MRVRRTLIGLALAAMTTPSGGCPSKPKVVYRCPPQGKACRVGKVAKRTDPRVRPQPRVIPRPLPGFPAPKQLALPRPMALPRSLDLDPTGRLMAIGGQYGELMLVNVADGRVLRNLGRAEELVRGLLVRFDRTGQTLVSARHELRKVRVWDVASGRLKREFRVRGYPIHDLAITPRARILVATNRGAEVWNAGSGRHERTLRLRGGLGATKVAVGKTGVAACGNQAGGLVVFSPQNGLSYGSLPPTGSPVSAIDVSADGTIFAAGFKRGMVRLSRTNPVGRIRTFYFRTYSAPVGVSLSPDRAQMLVAESSGLIHLLRTSNAGRLQRFRSRSRRVSDFRVSADRQLLAAVTSTGAIEITQSRQSPIKLELPRREQTYRPPPTPKPIVRVNRPTQVKLSITGMRPSTLAVDRRGRFIAVGGLPDQVAVYYLVLKPRQGRAIRAAEIWRRKQWGSSQQSKVPVRVAITPDSRRVFAHGAALYMNGWRLSSGRPTLRNVKRRQPLVGLLPTHDSKLLLTTTRDGKVLGWSRGGKLRFQFNGLQQAYWIGVSPNGKRMVQIQGWDRAVMLELPSGRVVWDNATGPLAKFEVMAMRFSSSSKHLYTYHRTGFLRMYDAATGAVLQRFHIPFPRGARFCDIRPDAKVLACAHRRGIDLIELPSGAKIRTLRVSGWPTLRVRGLVYSLKGNTLVAWIGLRQLAIFNFDRVGPQTTFTTAEVAARGRLGLPTPPSLIVRPKAVPGTILKRTKPIRRGKPNRMRR